MNKTNFIKYVLLLLMVCSSCNYLSINRKTKIIPIDSMAVVIADTYFLESEIYAIPKQPDPKGYSIAKYDQLFEKHGLNKETYFQNLHFYLTNNTLSDILIKRVDEIVEQRVASLRDSLKREE